MKKYIVLIACTTLIGLLSACATKKENQSTNLKDHTSVQESDPYSPLYDVRSDIMMVHRVHDLEERSKQWSEHGYNVQFFTCLSRQSDYNTGKWDGKKHLDEYQMTLYGDTVTAMVPTLHFLNLAKEKIIKRVIDAGINTIYMEEPEFFARCGYSEAFKREWKEYYGFDWRPQHESEENTFLSNKLKQHLYLRAYNELFSYAKEYGKSLNRKIHCYAAIHSLINYSQWHIISPEIELASLPCVDGYIAQVWTGTAREPNNYRGVRKERTFETAFMEYGCMESMAASAKKRVYFLTDPVEDNEKSWTDYKHNYETTYVAELLYPRNNYYEMMPWPERIYNRPYGKNKDNGELIIIPRSYSTQLQVMTNALNTMPLSNNKVSGSKGLSILVSSSMMFQPIVKPIQGNNKHLNAGIFISYDRIPTPMNSLNDPQSSNFFGLTMPFIKRGVPLHFMHLENVADKDSWKDVKVLLMTYSNMKPLEESVHSYIAKWVKNGGILVYASRDDDPFQNINEWWNKGNNHYSTPSKHLFKLMNISENTQEGEYHYGKGIVRIIRQNPKEMSIAKDGDKELVEIVKDLYDKTGEKMEFKNYFSLERGSYDIVSVMDENEDKTPYCYKGEFIDLFDNKLPIIKEKTVNPGEQAFLFNLNRIKDSNKPQILASAGRAYNEKISGRSYSFMIKAPLKTTNAMRILLPNDFKKIKVENNKKEPVNCLSLWDKNSKTAYLEFENDPEGVDVMIEY